MELAFVIWVISSLSSVATLFAWTAVLLTIFFAISLIGYFCTLESECETDKLHQPILAKGWKYCGSLAFIFALTATAMPSTKTGWMMAGGFVAQQVVTSDSVKKLGAIVEIKLQEVLDEATDAAKKKAKSINKE